MQFRKTLVTIQNQSAYRKIFVRFREFKVESFVHFFYFKTRGQDIFILTDLFTDIRGVIVLVLDISEYLFHQILQRNDAGCTAEFVHNNGNRLFLLHKEFNQLMRRHRFGHNGYFLHIVSPVRRISEHLGRMDIADHIIYVSVIHDYL